MLFRHTSAASMPCRYADDLFTLLRAAAMMRRQVAYALILPFSRGAPAAFSLTLP